MIDGSPLHRKPCWRHSGLLMARICGFLASVGVKDRNCSAGLLCIAKRFTPGSIF